MDSLETERDEIRRLVRELGEARGTRLATPAEVARLRDFFGRRVLHPIVDGYVLSNTESMSKMARSGLRTRRRASTSNACARPCSTHGARST